jgi:predicted dehydrogenase
MSQASQPSLRALVVGTGFGCRIQVPALRGAGFEVAALMGADPARTAERAAANGVSAAFTDLEAAIRSTGAEVVAISTPPHTHAPLAIAALELGCHVICEKPFARNSNEARAMLEAARKAGKVHALGNQFRFVPARAAIARARAEGRIGEPSLATFLQLMSFLVDFERDFADWWFDPTRGGGWLGASGSHLIDQARSWLGEFESVSASLSNISLGRRPDQHRRHGRRLVAAIAPGAMGPILDHYVASREVADLAVVQFEPDLTVEDDVVVDGQRPVHPRTVRIESLREPRRKLQLLGRGRRGVEIGRARDAVRRKLHDDQTRPMRIRDHRGDPGHRIEGVVRKVRNGWRLPREGDPKPRHACEIMCVRDGAIHQHDRTAVSLAGDDAPHHFPLPFLAQQAVTTMKLPARFSVELQQSWRTAFGATQA